MTRTFLSIIAAATIVSAATAVFAQPPAPAPAPAPVPIACPAVADAGAPAVPSQHIFCGDVRVPGGGAPNVAGGFHSRPNGLNPNTYAALGGTAVAVPAGAPAGIYTITNFQLTVGGNVAVKAISTMFPDNCSRAQVVASIRNAAPAPVGGLLPNGVHVGLSGATPAHCRDNAGNAFNVRVVVGGNQIITAYPAY